MGTDEHVSKRAGTTKQRARAASHDAERASDVLSDLDTQLAFQARDGDREAAEQLVRRNWGSIARYIRRLVRDERAVEDLSQDVFLSAFAHASQYRPTAKFRTWLYRIATNIALNHLRQTQRPHVVPAGDNGARNLPDERATSPDRQLTLDELRREVAQALQMLPTRQRIALCLFEYEQLSYEEIAAVMDLSAPAVRSMLLRARATLRARLASLRGA